MIVTPITPTPERTLVIAGEIGPNILNVAYGITALSSKSKDPIFLLINSPGGSVLDGSMVITAIENSPAPVYTVCLQFCASMAAIIHQFGTERYMVNRSSLMFHDASGGVQGTVPQMNSRLTQIMKITGKLSEFIAQRAGIDAEDFKSKLAPEMWLDAEDATLSHFNDKLVSVIFPLQVSLPPTEPSQYDPSKNTGTNLDIRW